MTRLDALRTALLRPLNDRSKRAIKAKINAFKNRFVRTFLSYDGAALRARLSQAGIISTDTLMVHANFKPNSGFQGTPLDLVNALIEFVGREGNLMMVSIPFRGNAYDYLAQNKAFNVKKTMSMMGLATEMFRRRDGTLRSLHPTHPVLAFGRDAASLVAEHEKCVFPCGAGSPFEKLRNARGKILFFDVPFGAITFFHFVEDLVKDRLPFAVYDDRVFDVTVIDAQGVNHVVHMQTFNKAIARSAEKLEAEMARRGMITRGRVGNSRFLLITAEDAVTCFESMVNAGNYPYDLDPS